MNPTSDNPQSDQSAAQRVAAEKRVDRQEDGTQNPSFAENNHSQTQLDTPAPGPAKDAATDQDALP